MRMNEYLIQEEQRLLDKYGCSNIDKVLEHQKSILEGREE